MTDDTVSTLQSKQSQFNAAMRRYETRPVYTRISQFVSFANITLQFGLFFLAFQNASALMAQVLAVVLSYLIADFINGLVHMFMDNNDHYTSATGPLVAAFHLHHRTPVYKKRNILLVYYQEAGSKIWLVFFHIIVITLNHLNPLPPPLLYGFAYFSFFSCLAEVSHYCCHVSTSLFATFLTQIHLFLPKRYHAGHHTQDNTRYAFLNGLTDPLLNVMAKKLFTGYKTSTDLHYAQYVGKGTANRDINGF